MDFKVKLVRMKRPVDYFTEGKTYDVKNGVLRSDDGSIFDSWSNPAISEDRGNNFESLARWFYEYYEFELVEDKKMFTKADLKNGDVVIRRNGNVEIAIVDIGVLVANSGWNDLADIDVDFNYTDERGESEWDVMKVYRPKMNYMCQFSENSYSRGELVYSRERDTKPVEPPKSLYNGKVVCIDNRTNSTIYTVGKIYQFENGDLIANDGCKYPGIRCDESDYIHTFEDWAKWTSAKFLEIKE